MSIWLLEPHDPLIFRDGRPFDLTPGARAASLPFPLPSVIAGAVRSTAGSHPEGGFADNDTEEAKKAEDARKIAVVGPLLVELVNEQVQAWFAPAPADALLLRVEGDEPHMLRAQRKQLGPLARDPDAQSDLPSDLLPVGAQRYDPAKPHGKAPRFWYWDALSNWLERATPEDDAAPLALDDLGIAGLAEDTRTHVQITPATQAAEDGALFQTRGLTFIASREVANSAPEDGAQRFNRQHTQLGLAVETSAALREQHGPVGGERRLVRWRSSAASSFATALPCPAEVRSLIKQHSACRLLLLTPAYFAAGSRPSRLLQPSHGITPTLVGIAMGRPQVFTGWDLQRKAAKPSRRLAPAGSVFFIKLAADADTNLDKWIDAHWMACVSDDEIGAGDGPTWFRLAGFGLAVLGAWDGGPAATAATIRSTSDATASTADA